MKLDKLTLKRLGLTGIQSKAIEDRMNRLISDYSYNAFSYIARKIIHHRSEKNRLESEIKDAEKKLNDLKKQQI